jgi:steroid 5-alpha reductase family enzyme
MLALWLISLRLRDASIVDLWWGAGFAAVAWTAFALGEGWLGRKLLISGLATLWGLRLAGYLAWRNLGHGEDRRYAAMRSRHGARFGRVSLLSVFGLQGLLQWVISMPIQVAQATPGSAQLTGLDVLGAALVVTGLAFEATADWQLARFRADPGRRGRVCDRGLWGWSRHPNYFGDALVWWGLYAIAAATPARRWTIFAPLLMTFLLLRVSGVALLERSLRRRRPEYAEYAARVPAFVPRLPRRRSR